MKRKIKFALIMSNGEEVRTLEQLKENFDLEKIIEYFFSGKLKIWVEQRNYIKELEKIKLLDDNKNVNEVPLKISQIFNVDKLIQTDIIEIEIRIKRLDLLKKFSCDEKWEEKINDIIFTQNELEDKLNEIKNNENMENKFNKIYLCGEEFNLTKNIKNIDFIGVNTAVLNLNEKKILDAYNLKITFNNLYLTSKVPMELKIKDSTEFNIDDKKITLKDIFDIKFCKTFINDGTNAVFFIDLEGRIHNFQDWNDEIIDFGAPIIDIDCSKYFLIALDENGELHYISRSYKKHADIPKNLPKIKQVACGQFFGVALDEFGKLHYWSDFENSAYNVFTGKYYHKAMPKIESKIIQVICDIDLVVALDENGKIYTWGYCDNIPNCKLPTNIPFIKKIASYGRGNFILALDEFNKVHLWGKQGTFNTYMTDIDFEQNLSNIKDIPGKNSNIFSILDNNGKIHLWGTNNYLYTDYYKEFFGESLKIEYLLDGGFIDKYGKGVFLDTYSKKLMYTKSSVMIPKY